MFWAVCSAHRNCPQANDQRLACGAPQEVWMPEATLATSSQKIVLWVQGPQGHPPPPTSNLPVGVGGACWRTQGGGTGEHGVPGVAFSMTSLCPDRERAPLPVVPSIPETHLRLRHTDRQFHRCRVSPRRAHPLPHVQRDRGARGRCASPLNTMKVMNISSPNCQNNCFIYRAELLQGASQ